MNVPDPGPIQLPPRLQGMLDSSRALSDRATEGVTTPERINGLLRKLESYASREIDRLEHEVGEAAAKGKGKAVACSMGCHWCCHQVVAATIPEVLLLAQWIRENFDPGQIDALKSRCAAYAQTLAEYPGVERVLHSATCPMLVDGLCTAHAARPLICRGYNSTDANVCKRFLFEGKHDSGPVPTLPELIQTAGVVRWGLHLMLRVRGMPGDLVELGLAIAIALENPDATERWLGGEDVFAGARSPAPPAPQFERLVRDEIRYRNAR
ncbi:MAG: hypothetical protein HYR64_06300 [Fimbriimonas ginsengisoli]|uniref:YkgJ family cysteine cluster protein n=1 Tax=Fimbriimonas ginsengisoli TaxID=1005039 RepID=A0A931PTS0_FIMGI|nr:hypothetical protein [Fimbriimonas ginsengisoli]